MTELFDTEVSVRTGAGGAVDQSAGASPRVGEAGGLCPAATPVNAVRLDGRWEELERVTACWRVESDWWRTPVRRDYWRCLLRSGDCVEICRDHTAERWSLVRRYD